MRRALTPRPPFENPDLYTNIYLKNAQGVLIEVRAEDLEISQDGDVLNIV